MFLVAITLLLTIPLSRVYRYLSNDQKHLYSLLISSIVCVISFGLNTLLNALALSIATWCFMKITESSELKREIWKVLFVWIGSLLYLSFIQLYTMYYHYLEWKSTGTIVIMVMVIKLTTLSWEVYDNPYTDIPTLLEWLGWTFFLPGFITNPIIKLNEYRMYCLTSKDINPNKPSDSERVDGVLGILFCVGVYFIGLFYFPLTYLLENSFNEMSFIAKIVYVNISIFCIRFRYYFAWIIADMAFKESGADVHTSHSGRNVNIIEIESATNFRDVVSNWNICTNEWLKECVYKRAQYFGYSTFSSIAMTNVVSALWHGFYPGYYMTFLFGGFVTYTHRSVRKNISIHFTDKGKPYYHVFIHIIYSLISKVTVNVVVSTIGIPFVLYTIPRSIVALNSIYWIGLVCTLLGFVVSMAIEYIDHLRNVSQEKKIN